MKKEAVSVLKPRKSKLTDNKVKNVTKKKDVKIKKKKVEKSITSTEEPRATKPKVLSIQNVNIGNNLKALKKKKSKIIEETKEANISTKNINKNVKTKKVKSDKLPEDKMAAVETTTEKTRVRKNKKSKIDTIEEPVIQKKKRLEPEIETPAETEETKPDSKKKINVPKPKLKIDNCGDLRLNKQHVLSSIKAIKKLVAKKNSTTKCLLPMENQPILLQVTCIKVPKTPRRQIRMYLPHSLVTPTDDVALFVPDLERGRKKDYEQTVDHWETIFREKGVDCIKQIIPLNQVKTEYDQFEMKRKLAMSYDYFLADGRIIGHLTHLLSKSFLRRRDPPTPVKLERDNLKGEINAALRKTCMEVHSLGNTHCVKAGTLSMKNPKLANNIWKICEILAQEYPGGWDNIRMIQIKSQRSPAIPIYMTLTSKNKVSIPKTKPKRPRAYETVEGELSTISGRASVTVTPEGTVKLKKSKDPGNKKDKIIKKEEKKVNEPEEEEEDEKKNNESKDEDDDENENDSDEEEQDEEEDE